MYCQLCIIFIIIINIKKIQHQGIRKKNYINGLLSILIIIIINITIIFF